jgi:hypothetical protein
MAPASAFHSACNIALRNGSARLTLRLVLTSTTSHWSGDSWAYRMAKRLLVRKLTHRRHRPQPSSASRFIAGASGFFDLIQSGERPER